MKLLKVSSISLLVLFSLLLGSHVYAVDANPSTSSPVATKSFVVANASIQNAKIFAQDGNTINISFNMENGDGAQAGLKYSVSLVKDTIKGSLVTTGEYIYPEAVSLAANTMIRRDIEYTAPSYISGEYSVILQLKNDTGMLLGISTLDKVKFTPSASNIVEITADSCSLSVVGEKGSPKYKLSQNIDISSDENLSLTCTVVNPSKKDITVTPSYETYLNTIYGDLVSNTDGGYVTPISFKAGEKKTLSLTLPKANTAQYYAVKVYFKSDDVYSNSVIALYTIQGTGAYIRSFLLDKDYYNSGDTANLSILWAHSYVNLNSRLIKKSNAPVTSQELSANPTLNLVVSITDDQSKSCASLAKQVLNYNSDGILNLPVRITHNCKNPQIKIQIQDKDGHSLSEKQLSFKTNIESKEFAQANTFFGKYGMFIITFGILVVAGVALYFINIKKKQNETTTK